MPLIKGTLAPQYPVDEYLHIDALAAPSRGARETSAWKITMRAGNPGTAHFVDHEQLFLVVSGRAHATVEGVEQVLEAGDALIVPAGETFCIANHDAEPFEAFCVMPVGSLATVPGQAPFGLPWAQ